MNQQLPMPGQRVAARTACPRWKSGAHLYAPAVIAGPQGLQNAAVCICGAVSGRPTPAAHHIDITRQGLRPPPGQP